MTDRPTLTLYTGVNKIHRLERNADDLKKAKGLMVHQDPCFYWRARQDLNLRHSDS